MAINAYIPRAGVVLDVLLEDYGDGTTGTLHTIECVPRSVEIERNDHRSADTFSLDLDYQTFPFDPRAIRSIRVSILLGDVGDPTGQLTDADGSAMAFIGFVDVPEVKMDAGGSVVSLSGRDYTGPFLDTPWSGLAIDVARSLGDVVDGIVSTVPGTEGVRVGYSMGAEALVMADVIGRPKFAAQAGDDTWTVLCDLCGRAGLIPVITLDMLLILTPADFGVSRQTFLGSDTFAPNRARFEYGSKVGNLSSLAFKRDASEAKTKQVEVRAFNEATRTTLIATWPTSPVITRRKVSTEGKVTTEAAPIIPYYVTGSYTQASLTDLAKSVYTRAARQQIEARIVSRDMRDLDGADIVQIGNGDRITVTIGSALASSIAGMATSEAVLFLQRGPAPLDANTAQALVAAVKSAEGLAREFYVSKAKHKWSCDAGDGGGYTFEAVLINTVGLEVA